MEAEINEIKKALYKEKPVATKYKINDEETEYRYIADTSLGRHSFFVPISEMGEKLFDDKLPAQLLIRWLVK